MLAAADRLEGIQRGGVAGDQGVEEMPEGGQGLVFGRAVAGELVDEAAGQARRDLGEIKALILAPGEEAPHHTRIGAAGVRIGDPGGEELIGGKQGIAAGALEDSRDRSGRIERLGSGQQGNLGRGAVHGDLGNETTFILLYKQEPDLGSTIPLSNLHGELGVRSYRIGLAGIPRSTAESATSVV